MQRQQGAAAPNAALNFFRLIPSGFFRAPTGRTGWPAIANATRPDETTVAGTIADIADRIEADAPSGPVLAMIGTVLAEAAAGRNGEAYRAIAW